jgi:hypothetical protein
MYSGLAGERKHRAERQNNENNDTKKRDNDP